MKKISLLLLMVALLAAIFVGLQRHAVEQASKQVEIVLDYGDIKNLAQIQGYDLDRALRKLQEAGVYSLAIGEKTLEALEKEGQISLVSDVELKAVSMLHRQPKLYTGGDTYLLTDDRLVYEQAKSSISNKFGAAKVKDQSEGEQYRLAILLPEERLQQLPLYLDQRELSQAQRLGFSILPRLGNYSRVNGQNLHQVFKQLDGYEHLSAIAFLGDEVLGYAKPDYLSETRQLLAQYSCKPALIEFHDQVGMGTLLKHMDGQGIRLHSIPAEEIKKISMETAKTRWIRAVKERNIRLLYIRPITNPEALHNQDPLSANIKYVQSIKTELESLGYQIGEAEAFAPYQVKAGWVFLLSLGVLAGIILLYEAFFPKQLWGYGLIGFGLVCIILLMMLGQGLLARKMMALLAAIVFPTLGVLRLLEVGEKKNFLLAFLQATVWSVVGGLLLATLLADTSFLIKMDSFSGVKFMHLLPLLLVSGYYCLVTCNKEGKSFLLMIKKYLNEPVLVKYVLLAGVVLVVGMIYILRTGNEIGPLAVSDLEIRVREWLEYVLVARPRTSEFLLGHPALLLVAAFLGRKLGLKLLPVLLLGTIGQVSIVSTFTHLHTPLFFSLLRVGNGIWLGLVVGSLVVWFFRLLDREVKKHG